MNQHIARRLPAHLIHLLINIRSAGLLAVEPIDRLGLLINGKNKLPPLRLRRFVGPLNTFEASGSAWACMLKLLAGLKSNSSLWDIGCGCGLMAIELGSFLHAELGGRYVGSDIHAPSILWCQRHIKASNITFIHHDLYNASYNPNGKVALTEFSLDDTLGQFNVIMAKSLFTHITISMTERYLHLMQERLANGGMCILSAFLFNSIGTTHGSIDFCYGDNHVRYAYQNRVESAVAYNTDFFMTLVHNAGLDLARPIMRGSWFQDRDSLNYQDIVVLQRN